MNFDLEGTFGLQLTVLLLGSEETSEKGSGTGNRSINVRRPTANEQRRRLSSSFRELDRWTD